jgi:hypothetical protein
MNTSIRTTASSLCRLITGICRNQLHASSGLRLPCLTQLYSHTEDANYLIRNIRLFTAGITCNVCLFHTRQARWVNVISICKPIMKKRCLKTLVCSLKELT